MCFEPRDCHSGTGLPSSWMCAVNDSCSPNPRLHSKTDLLMVSRVGTREPKGLSVLLSTRIISGKVLLVLTSRVAGCSRVSTAQHRSSRTLPGRNPTRQTQPRSCNASSMDVKDDTDPPGRVTFIQKEARYIHRAFTVLADYNRSRDQFVPPQSLKLETSPRPMSHFCNMRAHLTQTTALGQKRKCKSI